MNDPLTIGVIVEKRYLNQAQPTGMYRALQARGHNVQLLDPQELFFTLGDDSWLQGFDLIAGRGRSAALLCLLEWAERHGVATVNRQAAISSVYNKAHMAVMLAAGGVATPTTFFGSVEQLAQNIPAERYPVILKPIFGDNSQGLLVVHTPAEMTGSRWQEPVALAQHYLPNDGYDLKLYGIGDEVWAVRKASPFNMARQAASTAGGASTAAELLPLTPALADLGRRCGQIFGLDLYGVDCIELAGEALVIEINDFPNYTGVPGADERLADYLIGRVRGEKRG